MQWNEFRSHVRYLPEKDLERIHRAFEFGKKAHAEQKRKSGEPYFTHPIAVAHMLADLEADADTIIAALLHDVIEDTPITLEEIDREFNGTVKELIDGVTKLSREDMGEKPTMDEQIETLRKMFTLMQKDVRIMVIKLNDRLHNMHTTEFLSEVSQKNLAKETLEAYVKIADRLSMQDVRDELEGLCLEILEPQMHEKLRALRNENEQHGSIAIQKMHKTMQKHYPTVMENTETEYERKHWEALRVQLQAGGAAATGLSTLTAVFICPTVDSCYQIMGILHQLWQRETLSFQDYINSPRINGYQGLHTTIILEDGTRVRCKMRTREMNDYARKGITTKCFTKKELDLLPSLPWTERITALTTDTKDRSREFWETLQSDILGDAIVIHGSADEVVTLPQGSTALDGLFYLLHNDALHAISIRVNGKEVAYDSALKHGDTVTATLDQKHQDHRVWLDWVHTGIAAASIRRSLANVSQKNKIDTGRKILEKMMMERKMGLMNEFDERVIVAALTTIGYESLNETYIAIADGRLSPWAVYDAVFHHTDSRGEKRRNFVIAYTVNMSSTDLMDRLNEVHKKYGVSLREIRYRRSEANGDSAMLSCHMSSNEQEQFLREIAAAGGKNIRVLSPHSRVGHLFLIAALIVLWGLDPVISRYLLTHVLGAFPLTFMRFATAFIASTFIYGFHTASASTRLKPLKPLQPSLLLAGITLCITGFLTYVSLSYISATQYILFILIVQICTSIFRHTKQFGNSVKLVAALCFILIAFAVITHEQPIPAIGAVLGLATAVSFGFYTTVSNAYQQSMIRVRYPAYLFWVSIISILCTFLLIPFFSLSPISGMHLLIVVSYALLFSFVPYILYFELTRRIGRDVLEKYLPLTCLITFLAEIILAQSFSVIPFVAFCCAALAIQQLTTAETLAHRRT